MLTGEVFKVLRDVPEEYSFEKDFGIRQHAREPVVQPSLSS